MTKKIPLTLACGDYEIVRALKEGHVQPDGVELTVVTAMDSATRHWRFLRNHEFDAAEVSASSFLATEFQRSRAGMSAFAMAWQSLPTNAFSSKQIQLGRAPLSKSQTRPRPQRDE